MSLDQRQRGVVHALLHYAESDVRLPAVVFPPEILDGQVPALGAEVWHFDELAIGARRVAAGLSAAGIHPGDRVLLCLPTSPEFLVSFFGALLLGAVPTAVATPSGFGSFELFLDRFTRFEKYLEPAAVVATPTLLEKIGTRHSDVTRFSGGELLQLAVAPTAPALAPRLPAGEDLVFIQATSGSTGTPKGVQITHDNLAANCEQLARVAGIGFGDTWVSWLPLHHDMGLVGGLLTQIYAGNTAVLISPQRFLRRPADWLRLVSHYRGRVTAAPNFAFGYAAERITDAELAGVDLSSWRFLFCGAEPIHQASVQGFVDRFAAWGLPETALVPCYGMAEATLAVSVSGPRSPIPFDSVSRRLLAAEAVAVDVDPGDPDALRIADCGPAVPGAEIRIVDDSGRVCADSVAGRIQFRGPATTIGYFRLPEVTAEASRDGWWDTGDIGYLRDGRLRITGRVKDLIIIRGANYLPSDFERAAETVEGVRLGGVAAVGQPDAAGLSEELHLIVETALDDSEHATLRRVVRNEVGKRTGVLPADVKVVAPRSIPKTTSGKVQRSAARERFLSGADPVGAGAAAR